MGIGMGKMLGFDFPDNFNLPYISKSITEFWRRWHMTLSGWFREYVYIPLGGNRKGLKRQIFNLFVVELLTGIWHGANWNFICWGLYYFRAAGHREAVPAAPPAKKGKVWPHIYTLFLVVVGWAMFVGNDTGVSFVRAAVPEAVRSFRRCFPAVFPAQLRCAAAGGQHPLLHPAH